MENNTFRKTQNGFSNNLANGQNKHVIILKIWLPKSRFHYKTLTIEDISFVKKKRGEKAWGLGHVVYTSDQ
jgi:hypothetical protein